MSAKLTPELQKAIWRLAEKEGISFVQMQLKLLREAIAKRESRERTTTYIPGGY